MARHKSQLTIAAEYYPVRGLLALLQALPFSLSRPVCRLLLRLVLGLLPNRRTLIKRQMAECFPHLPASRLRRLRQESIRALADGMAAFAQTPVWTPAEMKARVEMEGIEHLERARRQGRGVIVFTAHIGCWELMAARVAMTHPPVSVVVRPLDNPKIDALVTSVREATGARVIDSHRVFREGLRHLRSNGILGILMDQNFYKGGIFVDFFGKAAATNTLVPILARRAQCAVLPMYNFWQNGKLVVRCQAPFALSQNPDANLAIAEDTQRLTKMVEGWIREHPSQWLWIHNRWKRRPKEGDPVYSLLA